MAHRFTMRKKASLEIEQHDNGDWTATVKVDKERGERVDVFEGPRGAQVLKKAGNKLRNILFSTL